MTNKYITALIIIGALVYSLALFNGFVWDDEEQILNNTAVHSIVNIPSFFAGSTFNTGGTGKLGGVYYRPVMMTSFAVLYHLFGPHAFFFHLFQIFLHIATAVLVFYLFKRFYMQRIAFIMASLFLVHPINVESVAYIAAFQDVSYVFFSVLTWVLYLYWNTTSSKKILVVNILLLLAFLSKEVTLIFMLLFLGYIFFTDRKHFLRYSIASLIVVGIYSIMRFAIAQVFFTPFDFAPIVRTPLPQRILMLPPLFSHYLTSFIWPAKLAVMQHWVITHFTWGNAGIPLIILLVFISTCIYILFKTRSQVFLLFSAWFVMGFAPYMQLFPLDMTVAERWFYFPVIGLLGMIGYLFHRYRSYILTKTGITMCIIIVIALSVRTILRIQDWKDGYTLYSHDILISHGAFDLENNLGVELFRKGRYDGALYHFNQSTILAPTWWTNWNNLGAAYERKGDNQKALYYYKKSLENGDYYLAYQNYASMLIKLHKEHEAMAFLRAKALLVFPYNRNLIYMYEYMKQMGYN